MKLFLYTTAFASLIFTESVVAEQIFGEDIIIGGGGLCAGFTCATGLAERGGIRIKDTNPVLVFDDDDTAGDYNWGLATNSFVGGYDSFEIRDFTGSNSYAAPFTILDGASTSSLVIHGTGNIGFGTSMPQRDLHVVGPNSPSLRLEQDTSGGFGHHTWDISANNNGFVISDVGLLSVVPFRIENGADPASFHLDSDGYVGLGTIAPDGKLHTKGNGHQIVYFESSDSNAVQVRFRTDSENRRFLATNNADEVKSQIIFGDDEIKFTGATDSGANLWLTIGPSGIVSQGPTCNPGPCDATFNPDAFEVPSIEDHAAFMWENQHLWAVGPTTSDQPFNLTQKAGGMLHELEVAHIYIDQLHERLSAQESLNTTLIKRLDAMEAQLQVQ